MPFSNLTPDRSRSQAPLSNFGSERSGTHHDAGARSPVDQAAMVSHLMPYDPAFQQRLRQLAAVFAYQGNPATAGQRAYGAIYETLVGQATLLAYIDNFRLLAFLCLLCISGGAPFES